MHMSGFLRLLPDKRKFEPVRFGRNEHRREWVGRGENHHPCGGQDSGYLHPQRFQRDDAVPSERRRSVGRVADYQVHRRTRDGRQNFEAVAAVEFRTANLMKLMISKVRQKTLCLLWFLFLLLFFVSFPLIAFAIIFKQ